jgi:hypothetical protein
MLNYNAPVELHCTLAGLPFFIQFFEARMLEAWNDGMPVCLTSDHSGIGMKRSANA